MLERRVDTLDLGWLVEHLSCLHLNILPVRVGQQILPYSSLPSLAPAEEFPSEFLVRPRDMGITEVVVVPIGPEILSELTDYVIGLVGPESVLGEPGKVTTLWIFRVGMRVAGMSYVPVSRHA